MSTITREIIHNVLINVGQSTINEFSEKLIYSGKYHYVSIKSALVYVCYTVYKMGLTHLGGLFGLNHATILHHVKKVAGELNVNIRTTKVLIERVAKELDRLLAVGSVNNLSNSMHLWDYIGKSDIHATANIAFKCQIYRFDGLSEMNDLKALLEAEGQSVEICDTNSSDGRPCLLINGEIELPEGDVLLVWASLIPKINSWFWVLDYDDFYTLLPEQTT